MKNDIEAVNNANNAELLANTFVTVHSSDNLSPSERQSRDKTLAQHVELITPACNTR